MSASTHTDTTTEQKLTNLLVTELLAHQFCFPVQWIKTQDVILRDFRTQRVVEVGPAGILGNMIKRSLDARGLQREILSCQRNADEIYYQSHPGAEHDRPIKVKAQEPLPSSPVHCPSPPLAMPPSEPPATFCSEGIPDKCVDPLKILTVVTAVALKKQPSDISPDENIRALCGGRSALQNEIIGDLTREFASLPDRSEETALIDLSGKLADSCLGTKLGPYTSSLMSKMVSSKMPAGSNVTSMRQSLKRRWRFGSGLQDRALLLAVSQPPTSRLGSVNEVDKFVDSIATATLRRIGIDPHMRDSSGAASGQQPAAEASVGISETARRDLEERLQRKDRALLEVYAKLVGYDLNAAESEKQQSQAIIRSLQTKIDAWGAEHGEVYQKGIEPHFEVSKARVYDSYWNWAIQDLLTMFNDALSGKTDREVELRSSIPGFVTRVTPRFLEVISYLLSVLEGLKESSRTDPIRRWLLELRMESAMANAQGQRPSFRHSVPATFPILEMDTKGKVTVLEKPRQTLTARRGNSSAVSSDCSRQKNADSCGSCSSYEELFNEPLSQVTTPDTAESPSRLALSTPDRPPGSPYSDAKSGLQWIPEIQTKKMNTWRRNGGLTNGYLDWFERARNHGITFHDQTILITGAGKSSIGSEVISLLLAAGAKVLVTTSSYSKETVEYYQRLYRSDGSQGSQLVVVPFNGGSYQDVLKLVKYIYDGPAKGGLGWDLDHVMPFAAVVEGGRAVDQIDDKSELARRVMLTNLERLLGAIKVQKKQRRIDSHPTHVLLPLSPNHGSFGRDGLYSESKIGLEALLSKWWSEDWSDYLTLCGVVIGWTRGTRLMGHNDVLAAGLEETLGIQTFSAAEMAWHIIGLMDAKLASFCDLEPMKVDLAGNLSSAVRLDLVCERIKREIQSKSDIKRALFEERGSERRGNDPLTPPPVSRKARIEVDDMDPPTYNEIQPLTDQLAGMVDLDRVVVVVGFGEAGPCGSARTRWEAECSGTFSVNGCVELAWMTGLVKYHHGKAQGRDYCGLLDAGTQQPIADAEVKVRYEDYIIKHTGIRIVEQRPRDTAGPDEQETLHEVAITEDFGPFEVSLETADELMRRHGQRVVICKAADRQFSATIKAGTTLFIPKAAPVHHAVGAQMPSGWDARIYGIPEDVVSQVDPVTLYALVATVEAFLSAGIRDPYELYDFIDVADVGNAVGSGHGGQASLLALFKHRFLDRQVQKDVLAETFVNSTAAWINMLLCGSSGPIRTPVGACATSLESIETGYELIRSGRAKAVLVGGADTLERETAHEFSNMQATINVDKDLAAGRTPKEASRPMTTTRGGFVEGEGCGVQLLTTARLALDMGLPIRAIIALAHTASHQIGRSVPAPGKGLLSIAGEKRIGKFPSPLLSLPYRRRQLGHRRVQIEEKRKLECDWFREHVKHNDTDSTESPYGGSIEYQKRCLEQIDDDAKRAYREAQNTYGNDFWRDYPSISPLRGALAVWGLTIDDLSVASLHGTSTVKNDLNETDVIQRQLEWLGRTKGNVLPCVAQKSILGHGKGAAGAFAVNGSLQTLRTGIIPGNRNADNIDPKLQARDLLFFPSETYCSATPIKAFSVTSFGFGQKGAQVIGVHPRYVFATLSQSEFHGYQEKVRGRKLQASGNLQDGMYSGQLVRIKDRNFYEDKILEEHLLSRGG